MTMGSWESPRVDHVGVIRKYYNGEPRSILEIGVYQCCSLMGLAREFPEAEIIGIDSVSGLANADTVLSKWAEFVKQPEARNVRLFISDSVKGIDSLNMTWDVIHIDGGHHTEQALADFTAARSKLNDGGLIVFDDMPDENVANAFNQIESGFKAVEGRNAAWRES